MTIRTALAASTLLLLSGQALANPLPDGVGDPDDGYYIPPGSFDHDVPDAGTPEQQQMMADAIDQMIALAQALLTDLTTFGDLAVADLDAFIASGAQPWEIYDYAVSLEEAVDGASRDVQDEIADNVVPIFGPIEDSLPKPPTELLTAAFGPTLTSIALVRMEADFYVLELASRRPMERPDDPSAVAASSPPPPPPAPLTSPPERSTSGDEGGASDTTPPPSPPAPPATPDTEASDSDTDASPPSTTPQRPLTRQEQRQADRLDKRIDREEAKLEKLASKSEAKEARQREKVEAIEARASQRLERERAKLASIDPSDTRKLERQRARLVKLEERTARQVDKQRERLAQMEAQHAARLDQQRHRIEQAQAELDTITIGRSSR